MSPAELVALPAAAYLTPDVFKTAFDCASEQEAKGLQIATEFDEINIAVNSVWSASMRRPSSSSYLQSYEAIGYHANTAALLRGFLAGTARVIVHRYRDGQLDRVVIKEAQKAVGA
ncbi:MAG: hypothetical protein E6Q97_33540 [Desulfurellales bacterium]|nr:MAG: hypothetical protein E6Q97_33540 [Desulfurellales bacterium]